MAAVASLDQQALALRLRHPARRATHPLIGMALIRIRTDIQNARGRNGHNFSTFLHFDAFDGDLSGRFETGRGLRDLADRLIGNVLPLDGPLGPDPKDHNAAGSVQEGTQRPHPFLQLAGRTLELQLGAFP